jgi:crotonobetainyl-CoA:carnitine CoA-transferase CaiB-like acyl-CoA transferase
VTRVDQYRANARQCRELAANMPSPGQREAMLQMAEAWDSLAEDRLRYVQRMGFAWDDE